MRNSASMDVVPSYAHRLALVSFFGLVISIPFTNSGVEVFAGLAILLSVVYAAFMVRQDAELLKAVLRDRIAIFAMLFFIVMGVSLVNCGEYLGQGARAWICKWGEGIAVLLAMRLILTKKKAEQLVIALAVAGAVAAIDGIVQKMTGTDFIRGNAIVAARDFKAVSGAFGHYNDYAALLAVILFVNVGIFLRYRNIWARVAVSLSQILVVLDLLFTYSRGAWVSVVLVIMLLSFVFLRTRHMLFALLAFAVFISLISLDPSISQRVMYMTIKGGDAGRLDIWKAGFLMVKDSPVIGCGLNTFTARLQEHSMYSNQYAHNCYVQILAETGIAGLISFLALICVAMARAFNGLKARANGILLGLFGGMSAFLAHSFFDTQLYTIRLSILFWAMMGLISVLTSANAERPGTTR
ncbi:MAG: O-antigen ligase family protein [Candidatus Omnitrophica bacterium]|nr:O-antigen ligase family protein [Candidatus Omnitrophota bacterium]